MGRDHYRSKDGMTHSFEGPYKTDSTDIPTLPCLFCGWLFISVWPVPFFILASLLPKPSPDFSTFANGALDAGNSLVLPGACLFAGIFVAGRLLRQVCSDKTPAALEERGSSKVQHALDWWWVRHPNALFLSIIILIAIAKVVIIEPLKDAFVGSLGFDYIESAIDWFYMCLLSLAAGIGICAISSLFLKAPDD